VIPAFIDIGQRFSVGEAEELKAFHTAGFLGNEFGPFLFLILVRAWKAFALLLEWTQRVSKDAISYTMNL
jgi:hypothetical protein